MFQLFHSCWWQVTDLLDGAALEDEIHMQSSNPQFVSTTEMAQTQELRLVKGGEEMSFRQATISPAVSTRACRQLLKDPQVSLPSDQI